LDIKLLQLSESRTLYGKEFQEDGAATANARLARCVCVLGSCSFPKWSIEDEVSLQVLLVMFLQSPEMSVDIISGHYSSKHLLNA